MGAWGTALFSDDTASDVREDFRTLIGDGLTAEQATAALLDEWGSSVDDRDEGPSFWLALASTQWSLGRLLPHVRAKALEIIDSGADLARWKEDTVALAKRRIVLERLRAQLESPMPAPKKVSRRFRNTNDWAVGSVHGYRLKSQQWCLFRVIGHHEDKGGRAPVVELLQWSGPELPADGEIAKLGVWRHRYPNGRESTQFMIGATSGREQPTARLRENIAVSRPAQERGVFTVLLWRYLDRELEKLFGLA
jgi:hypothetical protein